MNHEYQRPVAHEVSQDLEPLSKDSPEADTRLVAGTRKLMMVMFWILKLPPVPDQEAIDSHIADIAKEYDQTHL